MVCKRTKIQSVLRTGRLDDYLLFALMWNEMRTLLGVSINNTKRQYLYISSLSRGNMGKHDDLLQVKLA